MTHDSESIVELSVKEFDEFISKNKVVLVDFWAPWCMPCQMQGRMIEEKLSELPKGARLAKVNVDINPSIAQRFSIMGIPQMYLFVDGKPGKGWTGVTPASVLFDEMKKHL